MAALQRAFPQAEWDVLTTTMDSQIDDKDKQHPAKWLAKLSNSERRLSYSPLTIFLAS